MGWWENGGKTGMFIKVCKCLTIFCNNTTKSAEYYINTCPLSWNRKTKKKIIFFTLIWLKQRTFGPGNTDVRCMLQKLWEREEWTPAKNRRQENEYLLWYLCTDNGLSKISSPTRRLVLRTACSSGFTLRLILQLHETVLIKGLLGWDLSPPILHTYSIDIYIEAPLIEKERSKYFWAVVHPILKSDSEHVRSILSEKCLFYSTEQKRSLGQPAE